jgi:RHS repeat-associated protein
MGIPGRKFVQGVKKYRYGFNGQEKSDDVIAGNYTAEYWEYDSRIGRRWNIDPVVKQEQSPYMCFSGNPIWRTDPLGNADSTISTPGKGTQNIYVENGGGVKNIKTFSGGSHNLVGSKKTVSPETGTVKSFDLDGHTFNAYFNAASGEFTGYNTITKDGKLQSYDNFFKEWNEGESVGVSDILRGMKTFFVASQYWGSPIKGFDVYESGTLKKKTPLVVPGASLTSTIAGGQGGWNTSEGLYLQPITFNNSYLNYTEPSNTASFRYSPIPGNPIGKGDYISQGRAIITVQRIGKFFENQIDLSYRFHSNTIGAGNRLKIEIPIPGGRTAEGVLGYRYEIGLPRAFKNIWNF